MRDPKQQILHWCRDGDAQAFREFYRAQAGKLWKFLIARGCDRDAAYDLLAEAFLRFVKNVCRDPREPVALLYRIALNLRIDSYRRGRAAPWAQGVSADDIDAATTPEPPEYAEIRGVLSTLPESEQNLLLMRYWIGLSHKEIAQALDLPEGTVRRQCSEILQTLRERLNGDE